MFKKVEIELIKFNSQLKAAVKAAAVICRKRANFLMWLFGLLKRSISFQQPNFLEMRCRKV